MRTVSIRNLMAHKVRLILTLISVLLGTAFVAGSFVFTDTLQHSFDTIFATSDKNIDARVQAKDDFAAGVPMSVVPTIEQIPGVRAVEPQISEPIVLVNANGKRADTGGAPSVGSAWIGAQSVRAVPELVRGHEPLATNQIVVNASAASKYQLAVDDRVKVVLPNSAVVNATIVGIYDVSFDTGGYLGALFTRDQAISLFTDGTHYRYVDVAGESGVSEQVLADRIEKVLPAGTGLEVKTGTQVRDEDSQGVADALGFVNYLLLGFGIVALLVGTFIIYNTFSMIVAQRQRELALLRAVGADRKQVRRSVVFEAGIIGLIGSILGLGGGVALAFGLHALLDSLDLGLPSGGLVLSVRTVIISLLLGTVVTVLAAYAPARRASRIAPVAAMREEYASASSAGLRRRNLIGIVVGLVGLVATAAGFASNDTGSAAGLTALGLLAVIAAAMLLSPVAARWIIEPLGRVVGKPFGIVGRLARTNAVRNPRRTAATAFALTLGLVLVTGIAVIGASFKASLNKLFSDNVKADYILTTSVQVNLPIAAAEAAKQVAGVQSVTQLQTLTADVNGTTRNGTSVDGPLAPVLRLHVEQGSGDTSSGHLIVSRKWADDEGWTMGTKHTFSAPGKAPITLAVTGIFANDNLIGDWAVNSDVYRALTPTQRWADDVALVHAQPGADLDALRTGLEQATNGFYIVDVRNLTQFKGFLASQINGLLGLLYGLLGLAIVIAILGIINTQALSVVERRREIGMLRTVGMQRKQVRRTIYIESLLIAVFGALLGVAIGLGYGALFQRTLRNDGLDVLAIPWVQAIVFVVLAAVVGVFAALWPGFRAARTPPLEAIATG